MKRISCVFSLILVGGLALGIGATGLAQDTLTVEWQNPDLSVKRNALHDAVVNETNRPAGRVYLLKKGGYYWELDRIANAGFPLHIVGEPAGPTYAEHPPVLQMVRRSPDSVETRMITGLDDITLRNLWITGADDTGIQTAYQLITIEASGHVFVIDNCLFDRSNFAIPAWLGCHNRISITNCRFRNLIGRPSTEQWEGRGASVWCNEDSIVIENNTFFNLEFTPFNLEEGAGDYVRFNHNTLVNIGREMLFGGWWKKLHCANNLIINGFWQGEGAAEYGNPNRDPREYQSGMMQIDPLPAVYGPEGMRKILIANNACWRDPAFSPGQNYGDSIRPQYFVGSVTQLDYLSGQYPTIRALDTIWLPDRPDFPTYPDSLPGLMWHNITDLRRGIIPATPWFWELPSSQGTECPTCVTWPLPENFTYPQPAILLTAGTDSLPLGDLNWFPAQKFRFLQNQGAYVHRLDSLLWPGETCERRELFEAEDGIPGGDAAITAVQGFSWFQMLTAGSMTWSINVSTPITSVNLKLVFHTRSQNSDRGQYLSVNDSNIVNHPEIWGDYHWWFPSGNSWTDIPVTIDSVKRGVGGFHFDAGLNTVRLRTSWGYQDFAGFDIYDGGSLVQSVSAADAAAYDTVVAFVSGAPWSPSRLKYVAMNTNGTVTWTHVIVCPTMPTMYRMWLWYQNYGVARTGSISVDGSVVLSGIYFPSKADSSEIECLSYLFPLSVGEHSITVAVNGINLDYMVLMPPLGVSESRNGLPERFVLAQNYPNPCNPTTLIRYKIPASKEYGVGSKEVNLVVYDILGREVATLVHEWKAPGEYTATWDASSVASGVYFYRLTAGNFTQTRKMIVVK